MSLLSEEVKETEGRVTDTFYVPFLNSLPFMGHFLNKNLSDGQRLYFKIFVPTRSHFSFINSRLLK